MWKMTDNTPEGWHAAPGLRCAPAAADDNADDTADDAADGDGVEVVEPSTGTERGNDAAPAAGPSEASGLESVAGLSELVSIA